MQNSSDNNFPQNRSGNRRRSLRRRPAARPKRQIHPKKKELMTQLQDIRTKMLDIAEEFNKLAQGFVSSAPQFQHLVTLVDTKCLLSAGNELQFLAKDEAAYYLFLLWQINYGRDVDYDLGKGFEQFKRDVSKFTRKHTSRGSLS